MIKLLDASREGRLEEIIDLVKYQGVNVNSTSKVEQLDMPFPRHRELTHDFMYRQLLETPVMLAAHHGHLPAVKALVSLDSDLLAVDKVTLHLSLLIMGPAFHVPCIISV